MDPSVWTYVHNVPLRAVATSIWWALTALLTDATVWAGLVATLAGVVIAFELERWRDQGHSREQYARALSAVRYELAQLHAICEDALGKLPGGGISSYEEWSEDALTTMPDEGK